MSSNSSSLKIENLFGLQGRMAVITGERTRSSAGVGGQRRTCAHHFPDRADSLESLPRSEQMWPRKG
ncbi:hypothetical protein H4Q26_008484 [Puccinia striiformis f. sp. tritici PST-130]|nr:hypothetical protein H4Q26_008484 [Puccinia striiformis f. sp. tritici PST-130]